MTNVTRRGLLSAAATGTLGLAACAAPAVQKGPAAYTGEVEFLHGVASGDPLTDRVIVWTRVTPKTGTGPIPVKYEVLGEGDVVVTSGMLSADEAHDYCVKADAAGLEPGTAYTYRFTAMTEAGDVVSPTGRTRTTAASGDTPVKLIVISCSNWPFGFFNAYRALSQEPDLDAILHLGDYIYEYGIDGYGGEAGKEIGRIHDPITECVTLSDYRRRHAQYKTDPDLQAAHAAVPWICTWDDHESANNAYRTGAQNHNPENNEGVWSDRKLASVQAYMEWLPVREPEPGKVTSAVWRTFDFGDVASVHALESRLTGRSEELEWYSVLNGVASEDDLQSRVQARLVEVNDPTRTMLGAEQEAWLEGELGKSVDAGKAWQVLANQVIMDKVVLPNMGEVLTPEQIAAQDSSYVKGMVSFSALGLPFNLDAWDGFPAARERLYASAEKTGARLVTVTGDTHTAWANTLYDAKGDQRGVEFGCTSITSPGMGTSVKDVPNLGQLMADANKGVEWYDPFGHGYIVVTLTRDVAQAEFKKVSTILTTEWTLETASSWKTVREGDGMTRLMPA